VDRQSLRRRARREQRREKLIHRSYAIETPAGRRQPGPDAHGPRGGAEAIEALLVGPIVADEKGSMILTMNPHLDLISVAGFR